MDYYDRVFDELNHFVEPWTNQHFEQCVFRNLDLSRTAFTSSAFINCRFEDCTLNRIELKNTKLYDVNFLRCTLNHVDFGLCNPFGFHVDFDVCQLDYTVFLNRKLKKARFIDCSMKEAQFLKCDLAESVFRQCNLELARSDDTNLTQADFTSSYNLAIDPDVNKIKKARFSLHNLPGLLTKYDLVISQ